MCVLQLGQTLNLVDITYNIIQSALTLVRIRSHLERSAQVWEPGGGLRGSRRHRSQHNASCHTDAAPLRRAKVSRQTYWRGGEAGTLVLEFCMRARTTLRSVGPAEGPTARRGQNAHRQLQQQQQPEAG